MRKWRYVVIIVIIIIISLSLTHTHTHTHTQTHAQTAPDEVSGVFQISNFKDHFEHSHFTLVDSLFLCFCTTFP